MTSVILSVTIIVIILSNSISILNVIVVITTRMFINSTIPIPCITIDIIVIIIISTTIISSTTDGLPAAHGGSSICITALLLAHG